MEHFIDSVFISAKTHPKGKCSVVTIKVFIGVRGCRKTDLSDGILEVISKLAYRFQEKLYWRIVGVETIMVFDIRYLQIQLFHI